MFFFQEVAATKLMYRQSLALSGVDSDDGGVRYRDQRTKEVMMKLWDRIQRGMDEGFDSAIATVHAITEKAGEGIELTRLRREKTRIETHVTRKLAELGNVVYEKIAAKRLDDVAEKLGVKNTLLEIAQDEARMVEIDKRLKKALKNQP